jgi:hypothetical protein
MFSDFFPAHLLLGPQKTNIKPSYKIALTKTLRGITLRKTGCNLVDKRHDIIFLLIVQMQDIILITVTPRQFIFCLIKTEIKTLNSTLFFNTLHFQINSDMCAVKLHLFII